MSCGKQIHENLTSFGESVTNKAFGTDYVNMYLYTAYLGRVNVKVARTEDPNIVMLECMSGRSNDIVLRVIDSQIGRVDFKSRPSLRSLSGIPPAKVNVQENMETFFQIQNMELQKARLARNATGIATHSLYMEKFKKMEPLQHAEFNQKYSSFRFDPEELRKLYVKNSCVDIHFNTIEFLLFLQSKLRRDSINNGKLLLSIFNEPNLDNAFFSGEYMIYGNGDKIFYPLTSIDVSAHELTHGLVQSTAGLEYLGHSGALNESFSDMLGTALELYLYEKFNTDSDTTNDLQGEADWLCGEDIGKSIKYIRNLQNPEHAEQPQPGTYRGHLWADPNNESADFGGVHTNSGVTNRCFYLLTQSLGINISLPLVYNCLIKLNKLSDLIDFRNTLIECSPDQIKSLVQKCLDGVGLTTQAVSDWYKSPIENRGGQPQPQPQPHRVQYPNQHIPYINGLCCPHCLCLVVPQRSGLAQEVGQSADVHVDKKKEYIEISSDDEETPRRSKRLRKC